MIEQHYDISAVNLVKKSEIIFKCYNRQTANVKRTLVGNKIVDRSDAEIAWRRCSKYIFILEFTPGFNGS